MNFTHLLTVETELPLPREAVFAFFSDAANLQQITPPELHFEIRTPMPFTIVEGSEIEYRLRLMGVPLGWTSRITVWRPPECFVDEQLRGPYRSWHHLHEFIETSAGTRIRDRVTWALPFPPLGEIAWPVVRLQLGRIFAYRQRRVRELLTDGA